MKKTDGSAARFCVVDDKLEFSGVRGMRFHLFCKKGGAKKLHL